MASVRAILDLLAESTLRTGLPVPVPMEEVYSWAVPLRLPRRGRVVLYTGALYQMMPYIERLVGYLEALEGRRGSEAILRLARVLVAAPRFTRTLLSPPPEELGRVRAILSGVSRMLRSAGYDHAYLYEGDLYSGVLLHDMGLDEPFAEVARRVARRLEDSGAELVVTVDPHTTHVLRRVYPEYVEGFSLEVRSYLELLAEAAREGRLRLRARVGEAVIHDPCFYARHEGIVEEPRVLLRLAGVGVREPRRSGRMTYCCGGPVEAVSPRLAGRIAETRLRELAGASKTVVVMCPICRANLSRANSRLGGPVEVLDLAEAVGVE